MSKVQRLIAKARPILLQATLQSAALAEAAKGAIRTLAPNPVDLEPPFQTLNEPECSTLESESRFPGRPRSGRVPLIRQRIYVSPRQERSWSLMDGFLRQLVRARHRLAFEVVGNASEVALFLVSCREDARLLTTAFQGTLRYSRLKPLAHAPLETLTPRRWQTCRFYDLIAPAAYSKLLTRPENLVDPPMSSLLYALSQLAPGMTGFFQCVFQSAHPAHYWHRNIAQLYDYEYLLRMAPHAPWLSRGPLQIPSDDPKQLTAQLIGKADPDRPLFAAAVRLGIVGEGRDLDVWLRTLDAFTGLLQHGGRRWDRLSQEDYVEAGLLDSGRMIRNLEVFRPGFLVNSLELSSLVHLPSADSLEQHRTRVTALENLVPEAEMGDGSYLGDCVIAGRCQPICVPLTARPQCLQLLGGMGMGKSELLKNLILGDIARGEGVFVLDPHGDLVGDLLDLIEPSAADRVVVLDWSDPQWIPLLNPLAEARAESRGILADNLVHGLKGLSEGWGHRAEHILHSVLHGLMHLPSVSLLDVSDVVMKPKSSERRAEVLQVIQDPLLHRFWENDLVTYSAADRNPVQNKLSLLLDIPPVSYTFMQRRSPFNFRQAIEQRLVVLIKLTGIGADSARTLGSLLLSLLQAEISQRVALAPDSRLPLQIHVDEAHQFQTDAWEDFLVKCRKSRVGLCLAHQYLKQFTPKLVDAFGVVGSTVIFRTNTSDATKLCDGLQGKVQVDDIISLPPFHAIARVGTEVVRIQTRKVSLPEHTGLRERVLQRSHERYYQQTEVLLAELNAGVAPSPMPPPAEDGSSGAQYDEF